MACPLQVRDFQSVIGRELRTQFKEQVRRGGKQGEVEGKEGKERKVSSSRRWCGRWETSEVVGRREVGKERNVTSSSCGSAARGETSEVGGSTKGREGKERNKVKFKVYKVLFFPSLVQEK